MTEPRGPAVPETVEWVPCVRDRRLHAVQASRLGARFSGQARYLPALCRHRVIVVAVYWGGFEACPRCRKRCTVEPVEPARGTHVIRELPARHGRPPRPRYPMRDRTVSIRKLAPATCQWLPSTDGRRHAVWDDTVMSWAFGKGNEPLVAVCGQVIDPHPNGPDGPAPVCWGCRPEERETDG